eukprot:TRINITY_DN909_c0_g1_i1.p1 TRINITY_DN909_c0_g1~~TRINITY_DN909_c0_g1_i1.p1  ORF type:complete len:998 (-),score=308.45 TRINITY_DN909_c0_g1_i1:2587-5229(-)
MGGGGAVVQTRSGTRTPVGPGYDKGKVVRSSSGNLMRVITDTLGDHLLGGSMEVDEKRANTTTRGARIEILAFEIATVIVRSLHLKHALQPQDIQELKTEVLASEGVTTLVSSDEFELWCIAAEDKRLELRTIARDVANLGRLCVDPMYRNLSTSFNLLGTVDEPRAKTSPDDMDAEFKNLELQAQVTADLYHELAQLKSLEQIYARKQQDLLKGETHLGDDPEEDESEREKSLMKQKEHLATLQNDIKGQEKTVRSLKRKSLWTKRLDSVVDKLVDVVILLHHQILAIFGSEAVKIGGLMDRPVESPRDRLKLGVSGMALQFANTINFIDNLLMRPFAGEQLRENLYGMLTPSLKRKLKRELLKSSHLEQTSTDEMQESMEATLDWLVTMGANTIRYGTERRLQGHTELTLLQTLHHAAFDRAEELLIKLLVNLNHIVSRHRRQGDPERSPIPQQWGAASRAKAVQFAAPGPSQATGTLARIMGLPAEAAAEQAGGSEGPGGAPGHERGEEKTEGGTEEDEDEEDFEEAWGRTVEEEKSNGKLVETEKKPKNDFMLHDTDGGVFFVAPQGSVLARGRQAKGSGQLQPVDSPAPRVMNSSGQLMPAGGLDFAANKAKKRVIGGGKRALPPPVPLPTHVETEAVSPLERTDTAKSRTLEEELLALDEPFDDEDLPPLPQLGVQSGSKPDSYSMTKPNEGEALDEVKELRPSWTMKNIMETLPVEDRQSIEALTRRGPSFNPRFVSKSSDFGWAKHKQPPKEREKSRFGAEAPPTVGGARVSSVEEEAEATEEAPRKRFHSVHVPMPFDKGGGMPGYMPPTGSAYNGLIVSPRMTRSLSRSFTYTQDMFQNEASPRLKVRSMLPLLYDVDRLEGEDLASPGS